MPGRDYFFTAGSISVERVLTHNGSRYRSSVFNTSLELAP